MNLPAIHGYVYWLLFTEKSSHIIELWTEKLKKQIFIPFFLPHLTLTRASDELSENELRVIAETIASHTPELRLEATGLDGKQHPYQSLYIKVKPSSRLVSLRSELVNGMQIEKETGYTPHISLIYGKLDEEEREKLKREVPLKSGTRFWANRLALIKLEGTPRDWSVIHTQNLSGLTD